MNPQVLRLEIPKPHKEFKKLANSIWKDGGAHEEVVKNGIKSGQLHEFTLHQWIWDVWKSTLEKAGVKFSTLLTCFTDDMVVKGFLAWVVEDNSWEHAIDCLVTNLDQKVEGLEIQLMKEKEGQEDVHTHETHEKKEVGTTETIYVGSKPVMRYVMSTMRIILQKRPDRVRILARGRAISRAVDVAEVLKRRYLKEVLEIADVQIGTEQLTNEETGNMKKLSTISITLHKVTDLPF